MIAFIFLLCLTSVHGTLPNCTAGVVCPPGGIWSDWATNQTCSTTCGSCSAVLQSRSCLSDTINCTCTGNMTRSVPCNTKICAWPSERTCCIPHIAMAINGTLQCGPLPTTPASTACCQIGGYWTQWSTYSQINGTWARTRECLSTDIGCPCTGDSQETQQGCPCAPPGLADATMCLGGYNGGIAPPFYIDDSTCLANATFITENNSTLMVCDLGPPYTFNTAVVGYLVPNNSTCFIPRWLGCYGGTANVTLTCDLQSNYWRLDFNGQLVEYFTQIHVS